MDTKRTFQSITYLYKRIAIAKRSYNVPINKEIFHHSELMKVSASVKKRSVVLDLIDSNNKKSNYKFPLVWLRDNCQCSQCFHSHAKSRAINWELNKCNSEPKSVTIGNDLNIVWSDGHTSNYDLNWLQERNFSVENRERYLNKVYRLPTHLWSKENFKDVLQIFEYRDVLHSTEGLKAWLEALATTGCAMIVNASLDENNCRKLANRIGFIWKTHYGEEYFVRHRNDTNNLAYRSEPLQMHTDLPYYEYTPGVNLLHCIVQSKSPGAFNLLTDGFYLAERIKTEYPNYYRNLTKTLVNWSDYGVEDGNPFHKVYRTPIISLDHDGKIKRITNSIPQRDSYFTISAEQVEEWYEALFKFIQLSQEEAASFKTKPGDILAFSNLRVLHGRTGYVDQNGNIRNLVGAFIDWDEVYSRLRTLSFKQ